jgi:hypothetical protein
MRALRQQGYSNRKERKDRKERTPPNTLPVNSRRHAERWTKTPHLVDAAQVIGCI